MKKDVADLLAGIATLRQTIDKLKERSLTTTQRADLQAAASDLRAHLRPTLHPRQLPPAVFDPSDTRVFGRVAALALVAQKPTPLADLNTSIYGSGIYALYYSGKSPLYAPISGSASPIYVGKSTPPDGAITVIEQDNALMTRLRDHRLSIYRAAGSLDIAEFSFRFLVVASGWESPAELELIRYFKPVWNKGNGIEPVQGFGNHDPGTGRAPGSQSEWDTLHTGRSSASLKANEKTAAQLEARVADHFKQVHPVASSDAVVAHFLESIAAPPTNI